MDNIVFITVEINGKTTHKSFTEDYLKFSDPEEVGEDIQDMVEAVKPSATLKDLQETLNDMKRPFSGLI